MLTATQQWKDLLTLLIEIGSESSPREQSTLEILNYHSKVDMLYPVLCCPPRKLSYRFMCAEAAWILSGDNRVDTIAPYAPSIAKFSDDGETFYGAYGPRIQNQIHDVVGKLISDRDTRQAVMTIWRPNPPDTKDVPCTVSVQWIIRGGRIHCIDTMRSSDVWLGWPYDVFNFTMLTVAILLEMFRQGYDVGLGNLYLNAGSQHLYRRNLQNAVDCNRAAFEHLNTLPLHWKQFGSVKLLIQYLKLCANGEIAPLGITWLSGVLSLEAERKKP